MTNAVSEAKKDWLSKFEGAVKLTEVTLGSPLVRHLFQRSFDHTGRNAFFISVFGRVLLGEDKMAEAEGAVYEQITQVYKSLERKVAASRAVITEAGIESEAVFNRLDPINAQIITPVQTKFLKVLLLADEYLRLVNTLWLEGEVTDKEKSKAELELKQLLRQIVAKTRRMRLGLQSRVTEANNAGKVTAADVATIAAANVDDAPAVDDEDSGSDPTDTADLSLVLGGNDIASPVQAAAA